MAKNNVFKVAGPFEIPGSDYRIVSHIDNDFWNFGKDVEKLADKKGCYIFAVSASGGHIPLYIGETKESTFRRRLKQGDSASKASHGLKGRAKGKPVLFFVFLESSGKPNKKSIKKLQDFLIAHGVEANPNLQNIQKRNKKEHFIVRGVTKGKPSNAAKLLRSCLGIDE